MPRNERRHSVTADRATRNASIGAARATGLTQREVAALHGVSRQTVSYVLNGLPRNNPRRWWRRLFHGHRRPRPATKVAVQTTGSIEAAS